MGEDPRVAAGEDLETEERADLRLDGPGMSDLINSAYGRAGYPANARAMALSSALRSRRASGKQADSIKSETFNHLQISHTENSTNTHEYYQGRPKPWEHPGCRPCQKDCIPN